MADEIVTVDSLVNAHAAAKNAPPVKTEDAPPPPPKVEDTPPADPVKDLLAEFNLESLDALKERLKPKEEPIVESPEAKEKRENLYKVELQKYGVEEGIMKPEDFVQMENLKAKDDRSLVYERWLSGWKEENPEVDPTDIDRQSREDFEAEYSLNSENAKKKARGEARIAKEAKEVREPYETSYGKIKAGFDERQDIKANEPEFNKRVSGMIQENIPEKVKLWETKDGEDGIPIEISLTAEQRREIYKKVGQAVSNMDTYQMFKKGETQKIADLVKKETNEIIWRDHREDVLKEVAKTFNDRGFKKGQIGAKQPFPLVKDHNKVDGKDHASAEQQVLDSLHGKK